MSAAPSLRGITWGHPRGLDPLLACSAEFAERTGITVEWSVRSLQGFADASLAELSRDFDLLVFDHPHLGQAIDEGAFQPLDGRIPAESIDDWRTHSVGPSFESYVMDGKLWGAPIDAAGTVAAWRLDALSRDHRNPPRTWDEVVDLAREPGHRVAVALLPIDALTAVFTLLANRGVQLFATPDAVADTDASIAAFELLAEVAALAHPMSLTASPIHVLEAMSTADEVHYSPLLFGYSNYSRAGFRKHLVEFGAFPMFVPGAFHGGVLGGAGLAVSAATAHPDEAFALVDYLMSGDTQAGTYVRAGGQPGHRRAWLDREANSLTNGYFIDTLPVMDRQFVRPRHSGYLLVQGEGGDRIHRFLSEGGSAATAVADLDAIYRRSLAVAR